MREKLLPGNSMPGCRVGIRRSLAAGLVLGALFCGASGFAAADVLTDPFGNTITQDGVTSGGGMVTRGGFVMNGAAGQVSGGRSALPDAHRLFHGIPGPLRAPVPPEASFSASPTTGAAPLTVKFTDTSLPGSSPINDWQWDFGDGETGDEQHPEHVYVLPGDYTVTLTVTSGGGNDELARQDYIHVDTAVPAPGWAALAIMAVIMAMGGFMSLHMHNYDLKKQA